MGDYIRLNSTIRREEKALQKMIEDGFPADDIIECHNEIGELRGALLEMAETDGLDDYGEALDY